MKLTIGTIYLGGNEYKNIHAITLTSETGINVTSSFENDISLTELEPFSMYLRRVDSVVVGFTTLSNMDFLSHLPNVLDVKIMTSNMKDISGLRYLKQLKVLSLERPTYRMDLLGDLQSLEKVYLDDWRPGAKSIFRLDNLIKLGVQKFAEIDLSGMSGWQQLKELWLNAGRLQNLNGIPSSLTNLRLTNLRKLSSIFSISTCQTLQDLRLQGCRGLNSLEGIHNCTNLEILSITQVGVIDSLEPLRNLKKLKYLVFTYDVELKDLESIETIYALQNLEKLIISKKSNINREKMAEATQGCEIIIGR